MLRTFFLALASTTIVAAAIWFALHVGYKHHSRSVKEQIALIYSDKARLEAQNYEEFKECNERTDTKAVVDCIDNLKAPSTLINEKLNEINERERVGFWSRIDAQDWL